MCMKKILKILLSFLLGCLFAYLVTPRLTTTDDTGFDIRDMVIDYSDEPSAYDKCLKENNIVINQDATDDWVIEVDKWKKNNGSFEQLPENEEAKRWTKESLDKCGDLL